jgi:hypothetical protein
LRGHYIVDYLGLPESDPRVSFSVRRKSRATVRLALHTIITLRGSLMSVSPNCTGAPSCAATLASALVVLRRVETVEVVGCVVMIGRFPGGLVTSSCTVGRGPRVLYLEGTSHTHSHTRQRTQFVITRNTFTGNTMKRGHFLPAIGAVRRHDRSAQALETE